MPIYVNGRIVGRVEGDIFYKSIQGSKHLLRKPQAIAFDISTLRDAEAAGARYVQVADTETGRTYEATIARIWQDGREFNRGFGWQRYLALEKWHRPGEQVSEQLALFQTT